MRPREDFALGRPPPHTHELSSLELSDTKVYKPYIRALLGTASHFWEVVVTCPLRRSKCVRVRTSPLDAPSSPPTSSSASCLSPNGSTPIAGPNLVIICYYYD